MATTRSPAGNARIRLAVPPFKGYRFVEHRGLSTPKMDAPNTWKAPNTIAPAVGQSAVLYDGDYVLGGGFIF